MSTTDKPVANPVVVLRQEFDDWALLFNPDTAEAVGINPLGVAIWKLLDGRHTLDQIVALVQETYDQVPATASQEVAAFVADLVQRGLAGYEVEPNQT